MWPALAAFAFAFAAGFIMTRLGRNKPLAAWERKVLPSLGWVFMASSFTISGALLIWAAVIALNG